MRILDEAKLPVAVLRAHATPVAILCLGHVPAFYDKPMLAQEGWAELQPLATLVYQNGWPAAQPATQGADDA